MMKRIFGWMAVVALLPFCTAWAQETDSASVRQVDDFYTVVLYGGFEAEYRQDAAATTGTVELAGPRALLDRVKVESKEGRLSLKISGVRNSRDTVRVKLVSSALSEVRDEGGVRFTVVGPLSGSEIDLRVTGNGKIRADRLDCGVVKAKLMTGEGEIRLGGKCRSAQFSITGSGEIQAHELVARDVKCSLTGNGNIGCHAVEKLHVTSTGTGVVYYLGTPEITKRAIGKGEIYPLKLEKELP